jgi:hypothetical protein
MDRAFNTLPVLSTIKATNSAFCVFVIVFSGMLNSRENSVPVEELVMASPFIFVKTFLKT